MNVYIYLDNNATTRVAQPVREAMLPFLHDEYANPASPYAGAQRALAAVSRARDEVASLIGADPRELLFTSGGTESNNAVLGVAAAITPAPRVLVSSVEHPSVHEPAEALRDRGGAIAVTPVREDGSLDLDRYAAALDAGCDLVSLMTANNETGVMFPIAEAAALAHEAGARFHTDAVQAAGEARVDVRESGVDYLSLSAHKLHGPKGVGALYVREGAPFTPLLRGGGQEQRRRAGTLNTPGIVGFGCAAALAAEALAAMTDRVRGMRDELERQLAEKAPGVTVIGAGAERLPNTSNLSFAGVDAEALLARLDLAGVSCSAGSACMAGAPEPSPVLMAMGLPPYVRRGAIRISLSRLTTAEEMAELQRILPAELAALRGMNGSSGGP